MQVLSTADIKAKYPFFYTDGVDGGSLNRVDEGAFNAFGVVQWLRSMARDNGVVYIENDVIDMSVDGSQVQSIKLQWTTDHSRHSG